MSPFVAQKFPGTKKVDYLGAQRRRRPKGTPAPRKSIAHFGPRKFFPRPQIFQNKKSRQLMGELYRMRQSAFFLKILRSGAIAFALIVREVL